ncbi:hypothetical protein J1N35_028999 [Gossypium stocksii]|uniref:DUF4283 domain-containing protein n=1 Tax=Gossypium stocksii TaxID=47602 RepID=A0A9D3ZSY5_9ROSI|nr:hypothetical protein J1N35_028999 [Gossypium stocksii]
MDIDNDYYLAKFKMKLDYNNALSNGPWVVFGHYLTVQPWSAQFLTQKGFPQSVVAWYRRLGHLKEGCPLVNKKDAMEGDEIHHQRKSIETQQNGVTGVHERVEKENLENG